MDLKSLTLAVDQLAKEKGFPQEKIIEIIEQSLAAAYKKDYGEKGEFIKAKFDSVTGQADFWQVKIAVSEDMIYSEEEIEEGKNVLEENEEDKKIVFSPRKHIMLKDAKKINPKVKVEEEVDIFLENKTEFGRIAAQTAKQVIMQRIREAEKEAILEEYKEKEGEILSGIVQRIEGQNILINIGKTLGILTKPEQIPGEFYKPGQRLKVYLIEVEKTPKGPKIFLSRAYPKLVSKLFELEVPEIAEGSIKIRSIAREAGSRTKIAVESVEENIDPIGATVGQRGTRVQVIINELGGEKIDIIKYSEDPKEYIISSLNPAKIMEIKILPKNKALAIVPEDQLSLAIGRNGQNVRLAAKLTGWKIDVRQPEYKNKEEIEEEVEKKSKKSKKKITTKKPKKKTTVKEVKKKTVVKKTKKKVTIKKTIKKTK